MSEHVLVERARALVPELAGQAEKHERERRVSREVAEALAERGMFRMLVPQKLRGFAVQPRVMVEVLAELARGDAASAWHVMTGATNGVLSAYLPLAAAAAVWGENPRVITAGVFAPSGRATPVAGGYRLSGRWSFASGCENASWLMGGALVMEEGGPRRGASGAPEIRSFLFPANAAQVVDTWDVAGLCGTGSHDLVVDAVQVPEEHTVCLASEAPRHEEPLYRFPVFGLLAAGVAAVGLGIARAAIDAFALSAGEKKSFGGNKTLATEDHVQREVARASAELGAGRAWLLAACDRAFEVAEAGALALEHRAQLRLAACQATRSAVRAVDAMYQAGGGAALYRTSPLQRHFRDVHAVTQHIMVSPAIERTVGRVLLGLDTDVSHL